MLTVTRTLFVAVSLTVISWTWISAAATLADQPSAETQAGESTAKTESAKPTTQAAKPKTRAELEQVFRDTLSNAVFDGTWQVTNEDGLNGKAPLGEPKTDRYTISKVTKIAGDRWLIFARIQYADKDVTIPVPVQVLWAGDTPIITLDEIEMPGLGTYSARVMVYRKFYAGTWFGDCYGGIMSGRIVAKADAPPPTESPEKNQDDTTKSG
jgi:hypothetical protein